MLLDWVNYYFELDPPLIDRKTLGRRSSGTYPDGTQYFKYDFGRLRLAPRDEANYANRPNWVMHIDLLYTCFIPPGKSIDGFVQFALEQIGQYESRLGLKRI